METKIFTLEGAFDEGLVGLVYDGKFCTSKDFIDALNSGIKIIVNAHDQSRCIVFDDEPSRYKIVDNKALIAIKAEKGHYYPVSIFVYDTATTFIEEYDGRTVDIWDDFDLLPAGKETEKRGETYLKLIEKFATANRSYQKGVAFTPKGLVLHSIGVPQPSANRMANAYNVYQPNGQTVCVHAFIEPNTVIQLAPWNKTLGHVGGNANYTHIGVEMCEPSQIKYTSGASFTCSDYKAAQEYVTGCYNTAVELFATLCIKYNLDPLKDGVIISHSEAYKRGLGSNHADPEHLWKGLYLPYTMDTFRKAVKAKINEMEDEEVARYKTLNEVPAGVYRNAVQKLIDKGIVKGKADGSLDLTEDMIRTMIYCMRIMGYEL